MTSAPCRVVTNTRPSRYDLVWSDEHGWGLVRELIDPSRSGTLSLTLRVQVEEADEAPPPDEPPSHGSLYFPDADREERFEGRVHALAEPIKARGLIEASVRRTDDGLAQAVPVGWTTLLREDAPRVVPFAFALHRWGCEAFFQDEGRALGQWADQCIAALARGYWRDTMRKLRRQALFHVGALELHRHVFCRILAQATREDLEHAILGRREQDTQSLLHNFEVALTRAATERGMDGAFRRYKAGLIELRRMYGKEDAAFWTATADAAQGLIERRRAAEE